MSLPLTPTTVAAVYACLRSFPPFSRWRLPAAGIMEFKITKLKSEQGHYNRYIRTDYHWIAVSEAGVEHFDTLAQVVGHEMIHLKQGIDKTETPNTEHNAEFRRLASQVCKQFGWDAKAFI